MQALLGLDREIGEVDAVHQMTLRAIIIYGFTLAIVRLGSKRFLGKGTAFDIIQEALRLQGEEPDISAVRRAYLERDGSVSVIVE